MAQVTIRTESCKSCGYCVKFCPKGVLAVGHRGQLQRLPLCGGRTTRKTASAVPSADVCVRTRPSKCINKEAGAWQEYL